MYLFLDSETGGLTPEHSLLTLAAIVADEEFNPLRGGNESDTLSLAVRHSKYVVSPEALTVNKIDLIHHSATGLKIEQAKQRFEEFVRSAYEMCGKKLVPVGHNLSFDLGFVWAQLMPQNLWHRYCESKYLDTMVTARSLKTAGFIQGNCRLGDLCEFFHVDIGQAHSALDDTKATLAIARALTAITGAVNAKGLSGP